MVRSRLLCVATLGLDSERLGLWVLVFKEAREGLDVNLRHKVPVGSQCRPGEPLA